MPAGQNRARSEQIARKQEAIAESLDLANSSTRKLSQGLLMESTVDAIESARRLVAVDERAAESDRALRKSLAVLPKSLADPLMVEQDGGFSDVSFSPDAEHFIILNNDLSVEINYREGDTLPAAKLAAPATSDIKRYFNSHVAVSNNLKRWAILTASAGGWAEVRDIESGQEWKFDVGVDSPQDLALSPDGQHLLVLDGRGAELWDVEKQKQVVSLPSELWLSAASFSPDGKTLALGGKSFGGVEQGRIVVWGDLPGDPAQWQQHDFDSHQREPDCRRQGHKMPRSDQRREILRHLLPQGVAPNVGG